MKKKSHNDEVDISDLILNIWNNKNKIIIITTAFLVLGLFYYFLSKNLFFSSTNIKPISVFENQKYKLYNAQTGETEFKINSKILHDLFIKKLVQKILLKKQLSKTN